MAHAGTDKWTNSEDVENSTIQFQQTSFAAHDCYKPISQREKLVCSGGISNF